MTREDPAVRAERITRELRAATSEAAGVLKDLTAAIASARTTVDEYTYRQVAAAMDKGVKLVRDAATEEATRINVILREQLQEGCKRAEAHIVKDYRLSAVIQEVAQHVIAELKLLGYDFTQMHE